MSCEQKNFRSIVSTIRKYDHYAGTQKSHRAVAMQDFIGQNLSEIIRDMQEPDGHTPQRRAGKKVWFRVFV